MVLLIYTSPYPLRHHWSTTRNIHFHDENLNDKSKTIIEVRFLWRIFLFCHRSVVTILQPSLSMTKSGIVTKNIIEEHRVSSQITHVTHLWRPPLILWWIWLHHWTNYTSMMTIFDLERMALRHRSPHSTFSIWRVPVGPIVTNLWCLQFIIKVFARSFLHVTCTYGTLLHPTYGTR
jgi:hypothetical protein